jgi:hypothetical protein
VHALIRLMDRLSTVALASIKLGCGPNMASFSQAARTAQIGSSAASRATPQAIANGRHSYRCNLERDSKEGRSNYLRRRGTRLYGSNEPPHRESQRSTLPQNKPYWKIDEKLPLNMIAELLLPI